MRFFAEQSLKIQKIKIKITIHSVSKPQNLCTKYLTGI